MLDSIKKFCKKILLKIQKMFDKILKSLGVQRKAKEIDSEEIFEDFYSSDVGESKMILDELSNTIKKVLKTGIMQEFNGNEYSLEIYPDKVVIVNNNNNKIGKCSLENFSKRVKEKNAK